MKKIYALLFCLFTLHFVYAQLDTSFQKITVEEGIMEEQYIVDAKHAFLQMQSNEKQVFRMGLEGLSSSTNSSLQAYFPVTAGLFLAYERRLKSGFSINTRLGFSNAISSTVLSPIIPNEVTIYANRRRSISFSIAPRWYFNKKSQLVMGKSGDNLNGMHVSLLVGAKHWWIPSTIVGGMDGMVDRFSLKGNSQFSTINLGWQRRLSQSSFLNFQFGTGISHNKRIITQLSVKGQEIRLDPLPKWQWISNYSVGIGLAFGEKNEVTFKHPVWEYHQVDTDMWKINLFSLFHSLGTQGVNGKVNIGYERSMEKSPFSIEVNLLYIYSTNLNEAIIPDPFIFQLTPRYYYNLNRRIKKGKTANNLSANYIAVRHQWGVDNSNPGRQHLNTQKKYSFSLIWGLQRRVMKHLYVDYQLGYDFKPYTVDEFNTYLISDLKIGLAF